MIRQLLFTALLICAALPAAHAQITEVANVKYAHNVQVGSTPLVLNGAGVRYKTVIKVYTAGLYLTRKAGATEDVLAAPGPKRMHIVMLREINAGELGKLFTRGMEDNSPRDEFFKSVGGIMKMSELFSRIKKLEPGESFSVDWVPGVGTTILVNGKPATEPVKEPEFFSALVKIWLGKSPADSMLKDALLGRSAPAIPNNG